MTTSGGRPSIFALSIRTACVGGVDGVWFNQPDMFDILRLT